ncbi:hypothetical protein GQ44DRAFT_671543 [Phaeosphaeriaceae sp. PMI808]|nr:hypothetical protein GQ44DRAFT_671543 [Phaeosphaeriaceae sp. PMI808]
MTSFGFSPSDVIKLVEISTRVYIAFKDANENSEAQVESLVREFQAFAQCLLNLDELMKEFGKPLPFPVEDFRKTLSKCEASLKPYKEHLVDKKMSFPKIVWTIKYIGKEKELDNLRKQITGHYQALNMCISFLQLGALGKSMPSSPLALPAPDDVHPLYKDWEIFNNWLKSEDERRGQDLELVRPSSWGDTPATDPGTATALYRLRCEVEDAIILEENRSKRAAVEKRSHLAPSDAMKQKVREMPPAPQRTYTIDTEASSSYNPFGTNAPMGGSINTLQPGPSTLSREASPVGSPQIEQDFFSSPQWPRSPSLASISNGPARSSVSTIHSTFSGSPDNRFSTNGLGISTSATSPESNLSHTLRTVLSSNSLATIALGDGALQWSSLCRKVQVERKFSERVQGREKTIFETQECDIHWRYREDGGISLRSTYRSKETRKARHWTMQDFPSLGPSIPLTTTIDEEVSIDFPRGSFGRLDKQWSDIKYTFAQSESSTAFQTLLYTNNGKDAAKLEFDRPIRTISSDKNARECRGKNLRLWRRTDMHLGTSGPVTSEVLILLFYTSFLEEKGHWVEEPHYAFEWLTESVYNKTSDKLTLVFSKDPKRWTSDKLFQRRKSSQGSVSDNMPSSPITTKRKDSMEIPGITRSGTRGSVASMADSIKSSHSVFGKSSTSRNGNLNSFGYAKLDIEFQNSKDRRAFLDVWKMYVKPLGTLT